MGIGPAINAIRADKGIHGTFKGRHQPKFKLADHNTKQAREIVSPLGVIFSGVQRESQRRAKKALVFLADCCG
jgi:hypothetical protein